MKSLKLLQYLLQDARTNVLVDTTRDWLTIQSRTEHEGDSFLTITLPTFDSWLLKSLEAGVALPSIRSIFRKRAGPKSVLPCFLHGLTAKVFEPQTGKLRSDACATAVYFIRQICLSHKKVKLPCSPARDLKAIATYLQTDVDLRKVRIVPNATERLVFNSVSNKLEAFWAQTSEALPRHGPGATTDRLVSNAKFTNRGWYERWNTVFSYENLYGFSEIPSSDSTLPRNEPPVKVVLVPKTLKTPRVIAIESCAMQFAQQLVASKLRRSIDMASFGKNILFTDQTVHRNLALTSSKSREFATLDMSEASDRVSCKLVAGVLSKAPTVKSSCFAVRSTRSLLPGRNSPITLVKYASMGSATTFPVEALCFYSIAVSAVADFFWSTRSSKPRSFQEAAANDSANVGPSYRATLRKSYRRVYVYGDDIVIPAESCEYVSERLETFGLKVNREKTFSKGPFRESCGMDAFMGYDVTPAYVRTLQPETLRDASEVLSWVSLSNQLFFKGCWKSSQYCREVVELALQERLPLVGKNSPIIGLHHYLEAFQPTGWCYTNQRLKTRGYVATSKNRFDPISGYDALHKFFLSEEPNDNVDHLQFSTERYSLRLRRRVASPY